mgnify:CR=1 FL=1
MTTQIPEWFQKSIEERCDAEEKTPSKVTIADLEASPFTPEGTERYELNFYLKQWKKLNKPRSMQKRVDEVKQLILDLPNDEFTPAITRIAEILEVVAEEDSVNETAMANS